MAKKNGSFLDELDELNMETQIQGATEASVQYVLLSRCDLALMDYLEQEDFSGVLNFNTPDTLFHLGSRTS